MFGFVRQDLRLAFNLLKMNLRDRYLGSSLGSFWAIANPLFMLALYTFVFGFVFKVRLPGAETTLGYVVWLISGYGPWIATVEAISAATGSVVGATGMVKNMAFKTELVPIAAALVGLVSLAVSIVFLLVLLVVIGNLPSWHLIWLPLVIALQFFLIAALGLWLSALNVFFRDVSVVLPNFLTIMMFATPIFYPLEALPAIVRQVSLANPFYWISTAYRDILIQHQSPDPWGMLYLFLLALLLFWAGLKAFRRAKGFFDAAL